VVRGGERLTAITKPPSGAQRLEHGKLEKKPVKIGVVGAGIFGEMHFRTFTQLAKQGQCEFVGFAELREEQRKLREGQYGVKGYASLTEMIEKAKPDAITVVTPDHTHRPVALEAANAGVHVLSEKPLDVTEEGCREIIDTCKKSNVLLMVDFHKRYDPDHQAAQRAIAEGKLGDVLYGYAHMEDVIKVPTEWFPGWAPKSSPGWFLGVHFFDCIRWIIGSEPVSVFATASRKYLKSLGVDTYDCVNAKVQFESGASISFDFSWILPNSFEANVNQACRIVGTKGMYEIDTQYRGTLSCTQEAGMQSHNNGFFRETTGKSGETVYGGYGIESIVDFIYNVQHVKEHGMENLPKGIWASGFDGLQATRMALAAHLSAAEGKIINLK